MNTIKRGLALLLSVAMLFVFLVSAFGCSKDETEEPTSPGIIIKGEYHAGDVDPVIELEAKNFTPDPNMTADSVRLYSLFDTLKVSDVNVSGKKIELSTSGAIGISTSLTGGVSVTVDSDVLHNATTDEAEESQPKFTDKESTVSEVSSPRTVELYATVDIQFIFSSIEQDSYKIENQELLFTVSTYTDPFEVSLDEINSFIKLSDSSNYTVAAKSIEDDSRIAVFSIPLKSGTLEEISELSGLTLTIDGKAFSSGETKNLTIAPEIAEPNVYIESLQNTENKMLHVQAWLVLNGTFNYLTLDKLTFTGDFALASDMKLESYDDQNDIYKLSFLMPDNGEKSFYGEVGFAAGTIICDCGAVSQNKISAQVIWDGDDETRNITNSSASTEVNDTLVEFMSKDGEIASKMSKILNGEDVSIQAGSTIMSLLEMCGVINSPTDEKLQEILDVTKNIKTMVENLNNKLDNLNTTIKNQFTIIQNENYRTLYTLSQSGWTDFMRVSYKNFKDIITNYNTDCNNKLIDFLSHSDTYELHIYYAKGTDGKTTVTLPLYEESPEYDIYNNKIAEDMCTTIILPKKLSNTYSKMMEQKNGRIYSDIEIDIKAELTEIAKSTDGMLVCENGLKISPEDYFEQLYLIIAKQAMESSSVGAENVLNAYEDFCEGLSGSIRGEKPSSTYLTPLDHYHNMIGCYYNFYPEAKNDLETVEADMRRFFTTANALASLACTFSHDYDIPAGKFYSYVEAEFNRQENVVMSERETKTDGSIYSYVTGGFVKAETNELNLDAITKGDGTSTYDYQLQNHNYPYNFMPDVMNDIEIDLMKTRCNVCSPGTSFSDYLKKMDFITETYDVICGIDGVISTNDQTALKCVYTYSYSGKGDSKFYFIKDQYYRVSASGMGSNGESQGYKKENWRAHYYLKGSRYKLNSGSDPNANLLELALYNENHPNWGNPELAVFGPSNTRLCKWNVYPLKSGDWILTGGVTDNFQYFKKV